MFITTLKGFVDHVRLLPYIPGNPQRLNCDVCS